MLHEFSAKLAAQRPHQLVLGILVGLLEKDLFVGIAIGVNGRIELVRGEEPNRLGAVDNIAVAAI